MRILAASVKLFLLVFLFSSVGYASEFYGKVVGVSDCDTIRVMNRSKEEKIRLLGIDCPEKTQDYGTQAKKFVSGLVFGKQVKVEYDKTDRYGRTLGWVYFKKGKSLNKEILKAGYAWHYKQYSSDEELSKLEQEARKKAFGLWSQKNPTPPWQYRRDRKKLKRIIPSD